MLTVSERMAQTMEHLISHDAHGYSQPNRDGDGTVETITYTDGSTAQIHGGDYDCSEAVRMCVQAATGEKVTHTWTGNERMQLFAHHFTEVSVNDVRRGDVLLRNGHTEIYLGDGVCGGFRIDENGAIYGRRQGDQTGYEAYSSEYDPSRWSWAFRAPDKTIGTDWERIMAAIEKQVNDIHRDVCELRKSCTKDGTDGTVRTRLEWIDKHTVETEKMVKQCYNLLARIARKVGA